MTPGKVEVEFAKGVAFALMPGKLREVEVVDGVSFIFTMNGGTPGEQ